MSKLELKRLVSARLGVRNLHVKWRGDQIFIFFLPTSVCSSAPDLLQWPRCVGYHSMPPPGALLSPPLELVSLR